MPNLLEKRDRWGRGSALYILAAAVLLLPPAIWSVSRTEMRNDVPSWLPDDDPQAMALAEFQRIFPQKDRLLMSWEGCSLTDDRIEQLAIQLEGIPDSNGVRQGGSPYIDSVLTPRNLLKQMRVETVPAIDRLQGTLIGPGPLRLRLSEAGKARGRFLTEDLAKLGREQLGIDLTIVNTEEDPGWVKPTVPEVTGVFEVDEDLEDYLQNQPLFDVALEWPGMHGNDELLDRFIKIAKGMRGQPSTVEPTGALLVEDCFFHAGSHAAVAIALTEAGLEERKKAIDTIRSAAEAVGVAPDAMKLGGRLVASSELNQAVKKAAWDPAFPVWDFVHRSPILFSFLITMVFSFLLLRSVRLALLVMIVSAYTVALSMALLPATGTYLNMVLVVMPTLLMVLTTSAAIHLANYWRHAAHDDDCSDANSTAVIKAARQAAKPCLLASFTTAIGLLSLCSSTLIPVRDFGIFSALGCGISAVVVLYVLPSLMMYWRSKRPSEQELRKENWNLLGRYVFQYRTPIIVACSVLACVSIYGLNWFRTETKVIRYFPEESRIIRDYRFIEQNLCGIVPVDIVIRFDSEAQDQLDMFQRMEIVRKIESKVKQHTDISGAVSLATFNPERNGPGKNAFKRMAYRRAARGFEEFIKVGVNHPDADEIQFETSSPDDDAEKGEGDEEFADGKGPKREYAFTSLIAYDRNTGGLDKAPDECWRISAQVAIMSDLDYGVLMDDLDRIARSELKLVGSPNCRHNVTGLVPVFLRTQQAVLEDLIRSFGLAFFVIACVMMFLLRHPGAGLITMMPNLLPVVAVFGLISYFRVRIDIGTMITASVALGIAVDGTLHFITWFRRYLERGDSRAEAVSRSLEHCGPAMLQTSMAIGLGMLTLMPVELLLISRFGWLMAALIGMALIADIVLLPALLSGYLGTLIERTIKPSPDGDDPSGESEPIADDSGRVPEPHMSVREGEVAEQHLRHRAG